MKKIVVVENVLYSHISDVLFSYLNLGHTHISTLFTGRDKGLDEKLYSIFFSYEEVDLGINNVKIVYDSNIVEVNCVEEKVSLKYLLENIKIGDLVGINNNEEDIEIYQMYLGENNILLNSNLNSVRLGIDGGKYHTYLKLSDDEFEYKGIN